MKMLLTEVLHVSDWIKLENKARKKTGLDVSVFDANGNKITDNIKWVNHLCPKIKSTPSGQTHICAVANNNIAIMAKKSGKTIVEECDAGLMKAVAPIIINGEFIGTFGGCGKMLDDGEIEIEYICRMIQVNYQELEALGKSVEVISQDEAEEAVSYMAEELEKIDN